VELTVGAEYQRALAELVGSYRWSHYATLTFKKPVGFQFARQCVHRLVGSLGGDAYAYSALEKGVATDPCARVVGVAARWDQQD
jgi:hypothetical protein